MDDNKEYGSFPVPPEFVFAYRDRSRTVPEKQVLNQAQTMFIGAGTKYPSLYIKSKGELEYLGLTKEGDDIFYGDIKLLEPTYEEISIGGQLCFYEGVPYPSKGHPFPPAFYAINGAKRIALNALKLLAGKDMLGVLIGFALTPKKQKVKAISRAMVLYKDTMHVFIEPFIVSDEFCTPFTRELRKFLNIFFWKWGVPYYGVDGFSESFVMDFEYDNAYRFRIQDGFGVTTKQKMLDNPAKELALVIKTIKSREHVEGKEHDQQMMGKKWRSLEILLKFAFWMPSIRNAFKTAMEACDFDNLQMDERDKYHTLLWPDYLFQGKTQAERWAEFKAINKEYNGIELPARLIWQGNNNPMVKIEAVEKSPD